VKSSAPQKTTTKLIVTADFRVEGSMVEVGSQRAWRVTLTPHDCAAREYWVHDGHVYHALMQTPPPWNHHASFVAGAEVKRIEPSAKEAVFEAIEEWSRDTPVTAGDGLSPESRPNSLASRFWPLR
jgi:hypothetical protein